MVDVFVRSETIDWTCMPRRWHKQLGILGAAFPFNDLFVTSGVYFRGWLKTVDCCDQ